jgi:hypothetical protein
VHSQRDIIFCRSPIRNSKSSKQKSSIIRNIAFERAQSIETKISPTHGSKPSYGFRKLHFSTVYLLGAETGPEAGLPEASAPPKAILRRVDAPERKVCVAPEA